MYINLYWKANNTRKTLQLRKMYGVYLNLSKNRMTDQELEIFLKERVKAYDLKKTALDTLNEIFLEHIDDKDFLGGFEQNEIKAIFDRFEYHIERRSNIAIIRTRIGLYVTNEHWWEESEPIGYYELETNLDGEVVDDWLIIEKEKYLKDINIISHFRHMNTQLPIDYLKRNHIQYEFVSYLSLVGTLFISKRFQEAGRFVVRAYDNLNKVQEEHFQQDYLKDAKSFLKMVSHYLTTNHLVSDYLKNELAEYKN